MSILKVARMGHPVLRERARAIDKSDLRNPLLQKLIDDMIDTMHEYNGVGLAAPQVHEGLRLFVGLLDEEPSSKSEARVFSSAQRPVSPAGFSKRTSSPAKLCPPIRSFTVPSRLAWPPKKFSWR